MIISNGKTRTVVTAALSGLLSMSAAAPAQAADSTLSVGSGTLLAKGVAVTVPVNFVCTPRAWYFLSLDLRQRQGKTLTVGTFSTSGTCTYET